ncbi:hypothetical protein B0J11DRAFT_506134 [Dendryphion nanum]|uniref:Uncharacterized protein n=1 Tax=Dendryphion nanum TaxID=256645 RepID=A0A9P9ILX1_9PLEO|nr:hypothetical protein B0J11DRAFT_506134 [Dendryphion nanum]
MPFPRRLVPPHLGQSSRCSLLAVQLGMQVCTMLYNIAGPSRGGAVINWLHVDPGRPLDEMTACWFARGDAAFGQVAVTKLWQANSDLAKAKKLIARWLLLAVLLGSVGRGRAEEQEQSGAGTKKQNRQRENLGKCGWTCFAGRECQRMGEDGRGRGKGGERGEREGDDE